jgi:hypothetical protein
MAKKVSTPEAFAARPITATPRCVVETVEAGERWWCACGKSERQPYCDGSHRGGPVGPLVIAFHATRVLEWCCCKLTRTPPYCDRSQGCVVEER